MPPLDIQPIENDKPPLDIQPLDIQPISTPAPVTPEEPGLLSRGYHALTDPLTDAPSRFARSISRYIDQPAMATAPTGQGGFHDYLAGVNARMKGFYAGATEGLGDIASSLSSPANIATALMTGGESLAGRAGLKGVSTLFNLGGKVAALPMVAHGIAGAASPDSTMVERAQGLAEAAGGGAAMFHTPVTRGAPEPLVGPKGVEVNPATEAASKAPPTSIEPPTPKESPVAAAGGIRAVDPYEAYRNTPVGTTYRVSPEKMNPKKMANAIKLGFEYAGLDDNGRIILKKAKESPPAQVPEPDIQKTSAWAEAANLPRTLLASMDLSAPLRQGLGLIHKKAFWTALPDMLKAFGSEEAYKNVQKGILDNPMFQKTYDATGKLQPSFAEKAGLSLTDLNSMTTREESILSSWAEKVPGVRASNRAYTAFLNKLRADTFSQMVKDFGVVSNPNDVAKGRIARNLASAQQIAEFVNTASGRGSLGRFEDSAKNLSTVLFSPRLMASRLGMMSKGAQAAFSPEVYMLQNPSIRREYLKSLGAVASMAGTFISLSKMAGATVESDPASSDFGKVRFGDTRIDPWGGFQQYIVLMQRLMPELDLSPVGLGKIGGQMKSTVTGREYTLDDPSFGRSTRADVLTRFIRSKTNPIINFGWGLMGGQKEISGKPMDLTNIDPYKNSIAQRFLPMLTQDIYDLVNDETVPPGEKALATFMSSLGMGTQTYGNEK